MFVRQLLFRLLLGLLPLATTSSIYLYLYPVFKGCAHPLPQDTLDDSFPSRAFLNNLHRHVAPGFASDGELAVFRLLVLADPQLEGDSSLPSAEYELKARLRKHWADVQESLYATPFPHNLGEVLDATTSALSVLVSSDLPRTFKAAQKRLDLLGNDYYLAHIYRTLHWWTDPTHVTVLGDLIGSQWVTDEEFERRGNRYWHRVFRGGERVSDEITGRCYENHDNTGSQIEKLEELDDHTWSKRIINIAGNHDIGYSGDASEKRIQRFEYVFGRANWDIRFRYPRQENNHNATSMGMNTVLEADIITPTLHIINLNSLTLDSPPYSTEVQADSYTYINNVITKRSHPVSDRASFTLLLTHLPLHKREGICTDGPYFTFFDQDDDQAVENEAEKEEEAEQEDGELEERRRKRVRYYAGGLREQNHLSEHLSSNGVLQGIFGMSGEESATGAGWGRHGLILTGHDHAGCDVVHFVDRASPPPSLNDYDEGDHDREKKEKENSNGDNEGGGVKRERKDPDTTTWTWNAKRYHGSLQPPKGNTPSIREVTLRSMMGEYGGNAGLLSLWFDFEAGEWKYAISLCPAGVQHIWWAVHIIDILTLVALLAYIAAVMVPAKAEEASKVVKTMAKGRETEGETKKTQ